MEGVNVDVGFVAMVILAVVALLVIMGSILRMWRKIPAEKAAVITGRKKRVITGGGTLLIPVLERIDVISLENMSLDVTSSGAMTNQGVPINVSVTAIIKVRNNTESVLSAVEQFHTGREETTVRRMRETCGSVLEGGLREIISELKVEEIYKDREVFSSKVKQVAASMMESMGFELKAFKIGDISDENGYLDALGAPQIAAARRDAEIAKAEAEAESKIKTAEANRKGEAARLQAETEIAEAEKAKSIRESNFMKESETARAEADVAYEIQKNKMQKEITESLADAEVVKQQRAKDIAEETMNVDVLREKRSVEVNEQRAAARKAELLSTVIEPAEAARREAEIKAEADKVTEVKRAEADAEKRKLDAEATAFELFETGQKEAEIIRLKGVAEAEALKLQYEAEAEGMLRKAEAYERYGQAAIAQMIIEALPSMARSIAEPIGNIDKVIVWDGGDSGGTTKMAETVTKTMLSTIESVREMTGFDLMNVLAGFTAEARTTKNINISKSSADTAEAVDETQLALE